jgi:FkbM family methyltransferase
MQAMSDALRAYAFTASRMGELVAAPAFGFLARLKLRYAYATRWRRTGVVGVPLEVATLYLDRARLASDWETLRENFVPRKQPYVTDYVGAVVLDLGAHKGFFGTYALTDGAEAVISFEPEESNFACLSATAASARSGGKDWEARHAAVARQGGLATLRVSEESWTHALEGSTGDATGHRVQTVTVVAIADALEAASARAIRRRLIVKVDVEGAEDEIFSGQAAWELADEVFCEMHSAGSAELVDAALTSVGLARSGEREGVIHWTRPCAREDSNPRPTA